MRFARIGADAVCVRARDDVSRALRVRPPLSVLLQTCMFLRAAGACCAAVRTSAVALRANCTLRCTPQLRASRLAVPSSTASRTYAMSRRVRAPVRRTAAQTVATTYSFAGTASRTQRASGSAAGESRRRGMFYGSLPRAVR